MGEVFRIPAFAGVEREKAKWIILNEKTLRGLQGERILYGKAKESISNLQFGNRLVLAQAG
jgi:hypothetical protein